LRETSLGSDIGNNFIFGGIYSGIMLLPVTATSPASCPPPLLMANSAPTLAVLSGWRPAFVAASPANSGVVDIAGVLVNKARLTGVVLVGVGQVALRPPRQANEPTRRRRNHAGRSKFGWSDGLMQEECEKARLDNGGGKLREKARANKVVCFLFGRTSCIATSTRAPKDWEGSLMLLGYHLFT
jgi:hypothetical protein